MVVALSTALTPEVLVLLRFKSEPVVSDEDDIVKAFCVVSVFQVQVCV